MEFRWNKEKDTLLIKERGISFADVVDAYEKGRLLALLPHPKKGQQMLIIFEKNDYIYVVPCIRESEETYFLKTVYPSRKATKRFLSVQKNQL